MTSPRELRARTGTPISRIAVALGMHQDSTASVGILEATPLHRWTVGQLRAYVEACGCELDVAAVDRVDGERVGLR